MDQITIGSDQMITQISPTAWIACSANGIYASHMDHIWITFGSHMDLIRIAGKNMQHHVLSGSFGSKRVLPVRLTVL